MVYKIIQVSTQAIVATYTDINPYGGDWSCSANPDFIALQVPDGADPNGLIVQDSQLIFDQPTLDAWQRAQNKAALDAYTSSRESQAELDIQTALQVATGQNDDYTTHLAIVAYATDVALFTNEWSQTLNGDVLSNSDLVQNLSSTATLTVGMAASGGGLPLGTTVAEVQTSTRVKLSAKSTLTANQEPVTFSPLPSALNILALYRPIYAQIQAIRSQRDLDIANFIPPYPSVNPVYPA